MVPTYRGFSPRQFQLGEWKYKDSAAVATVTSNGLIGLINGLQTGNSVSQRVGTNVNVKTLEIKGYFIGDGLNASDFLVRMIVFADKQANATQPAVTDLLTDLTAVNVKTVCWPRNLSNRKRFKTYVDRVYPVGGLSASQPIIKSVKYYMKFKYPLKVEYNNANNGTHQDITTNALWILFISNISGANPPSVNLNVRMRYTDL